MDVGVILLTLVVGLLAAALWWSLTNKNSNKSSQQKSKGKSNSKQKDAKKKSSAKPAAAPAPPVKDSSKSNFTHSWLLTSLKGHTGPVTDLDFSPDGKYLATCSEDRSLMLWQLKLGKLEPSIQELNMKDIRTIRAHVQYDSASLIRWSPDSKALVTLRTLGNTIEIYKLAKKTDSSGAKILPTIQPSHSFPKHREADLLACEVASTGRFIMTCTPKNELDLLDLKGNLLASITTNQMETYYARISPDGRFVATSGFTPEVRVWEVVYSRSGEFEKIARAFELTGHTSGIHSFDFSPDAGKMVTASKDGSWRYYNTTIDYKLGQLATLISSGKYKGAGQGSARIALSPDCRVIAIGSGTSLYLYSALNGELSIHIPEVHSVPIRALKFDSTSRFLLSSGDKFVRVFHNVTGHKVALQDLELKLRSATTGSQKERIQSQLKEAQSLVSLFDH